MESSLKKFVSASSAVVVGLLVCACGNSSPTTASTSTAPAVTLMGLNPSEVATVVQVGQAQIYMLTVVPTTSVITWTSSNSAVLTVDSTGNATGIASGHATLTALSDNGMSATLVVQVVPVYGGTWAGNITVIGCTPLVGFVANNYCPNILGTMQAFTMSLTQTNSNIGNVVSGTFTKGEGGNTLSGAVSGGNLGDGGDLGGLSGLLGGVADGVNLSLTLTAWNSLAVNSSMTGGWAANITSPQIQGVASVRYALTSVTLVPVSGSQLSQLSRRSTSSTIRQSVPQRH